MDWKYEAVLSLTNALWKTSVTGPAHSALPVQTHTIMPWLTAHSQNIRPYEELNIPQASMSIFIQKYDIVLRKIKQQKVSPQYIFARYIYFIYIYLCLWLLVASSWDPFAVASQTTDKPTAVWAYTCPVVHLSQKQLFNCEYLLHFSKHCVKLIQVGS